MRLFFLGGFAADAPVVLHDDTGIGRERFFRETRAQAARLPSTRYIVNLCDNRYAFLTVFAAALLNRQVTLLPADAAESALDALCERYASVAIVTDRPLPEAPPAPAYRWDETGGAAGADCAPLAFSADQTAVIVHTSGSTGTPRPHVKSWGALVRRARHVGRRLELEAEGVSHVVATVPSQHMYGLENAIMLPTQHGLAVHSGRPFFPADVAAALTPASLLVTTPIHLKSLNAASPADVCARLTLSSTAPLPAEQAHLAEERLGAPLLEIYGSTETGVIATRRPTAEPAWRLLPPLRLRLSPEGALLQDMESHVVTALHDAIEIVGEGEFLLGPRSEDIVKVAGKRASLAALNDILCALPGVEDGVFLPPREAEEPGSRLAAFVVAPQLSHEEITAHLRERIDPAFLPRPLVKVEALPRNATGKLPWEAMQDLRNANPPAAGAVR
ncbi:MAG TPA: AMP-binding protein [Gammaproteobacteria bacterium]|nr:AMP-binding protein [Gammaproteobacteria bacterium]